MGLGSPWALHSAFFCPDSFPSLPEKEWDGQASLLLSLRAPSGGNGTCHQDHGRGLRHTLGSSQVCTHPGDVKCTRAEEQRPRSKAVSGAAAHTLPAASTTVTAAMGAPLSTADGEEGRRHMGATSHFLFFVPCCPGHNRDGHRQPPAGAAGAGPGRVQGAAGDVHGRDILDKQSIHPLHQPGTAPWRPSPNKPLRVTSGLSKELGEQGPG